MNNKSSVLICFLFVFALGVAAFAAAEEPSPDQQGTGGIITIESKPTALMGQTVTTAVRLSGVSSPGLLDYQIQVSFDYSVVRVIAVQPGDFPFNNPQVSGTFTQANQQGMISFGQFLSGNQGMISGVLANVVWQVIGDPGDQTALTVTLAGNFCQCVDVGSGILAIVHGDTDDDGVPDDEEIINGTNPNNPDSDGDGLTDGEEPTHGTNPLNPDSDSDGLSDGEEIDYVCVSPLRPDTDGDGISDGEEIHETGTNPCKADTDDDGVRDLEDLCPTGREDGLPPNPSDGCPGKIVGGDPPLYNNIQVFPTPETALGQDLNNNNSIRDTVLRYRDTLTGEVVNTGQHTSGTHASVDVYESIIAFVGGDGIIRYYNIDSRATHDVGMNGTHPTIFGSVIAFESSGKIYTYDIGSQALAATNAVGTEPVIHGNVVAFRGGTPATIRYLNVSTGLVIDTKQVGTHPALYGDTIAFVTNEREANLDLNRDGQIESISVVRYYSISSNRVETTTAVGSYPVIYGNLIAFSTKETEAHKDLNGDGKIMGEVVRYFDIAGRTLYSTNELGTEPDVFQGQISFYVWETWAGKDLNSDGDSNDPILGLFDTQVNSGVSSTPVFSTPPRSNATSVQQFDTDRNGTIDDSEFFTGIDQWVIGAISNEIFFELVDAWVDGTPVRTAEAELKVFTLDVGLSAQRAGVTFSVQGAAASSLEVAVYDLQGKRVFAGEASGNTLTWNLQSATGQTLANGIYFYVVTAQAADQTWKSEVKKLVMIR